MGPHDLLRLNATTGLALRLLTVPYTWAPACIQEPLAFRFGQGPTLHFVFAYVRELAPRAQDPAHR